MAEYQTDCSICRTPFPDEDARICANCGARRLKAISSATREVMPGVVQLGRDMLGQGKHAVWSHKNTIAGVAVLLIGLTGTYAVVRPKPTNSAESAAAAYTACVNNAKHDVEAADRSLASQFATKRPATRQEAQQRSEAGMVSAKDAYSKCISAADALFTKMEGQYVRNEKRAAVFYTAFQGMMTVRPTADLDPAIAQMPSVQKIVQTIIPPVPNASVIAQDLIGRQMDGWRFAYPSEFLVINWEPTTITADTTIMRLHLSMQDFNTHDPYFAIVDVRYTLDASERWQFSSLRELYLTRADTTTYRPNGRPLLLGNWRWASNFATYNNDGTWTGRWDDGTVFEGEWRIIHNNLVLTRGGQAWTSAEIDTFTDREILLKTSGGTVRAERVN